MPLLRVDRRDVSEKLWKWRYKLRHLGGSGEKTLSDFSSAESASGDGDGGHGHGHGHDDKTTQRDPAAAGSSNNKVAELGASASVKTLYEGPRSHDGVYDWVDYPPRQLSKSAARAQDRVAIKVFKVKDTDKPVISGRFSLRYHMLQVQNPLLVAALGEILGKHDVCLDPGDKNATFRHPFPELYFGYDDIAARCRALSETEPGGSHPLQPFLLLLVRLLDDIFADTRARLRALQARGLVSFKLAWTLFPRDTTVVSWGNNCELLSKVTGTEYQCVGGRHILTVRGKVLRFDGRAFLWEDYATTIGEFSGNQAVTELPVYPLERHEAARGVRERLAARGRKMLDYQGLTYASYRGIAIHLGGKDAAKHNVDGRVLIDVVGYNKHELAQGPREGADPQSRKRQVVVGDASAGEGEDATATGAADGTKRLSVAAQERNKQAMLALETKEPLLMYMLPLVQGYALKNKLWVAFFVEDVSPVVWNDEAYGHLVYNEQQKDLVMSFVESHSHNLRHNRAVEDVIAGKGQGLVMLLSGPPGTGKTLMAEAVADRTRRPLFYLQAEDLGINAAALGANIKKVFQMATEWDAVVLLDEADVFMAERHPHDIARNELVSIFLRELEYFGGIIFLTTNLYSTIDSAFRSRVSLHLLFSALTPDARMLIWRKFLDRLPLPPSQEPGSHDGGGDGDGDGDGDGVLADEEVEELAAWQLNGREIKTAVKMTRAWCDHKGYALTLSRLENGIRVTSPHAAKSSREHDTSLYDQ